MWRSGLFAQMYNFYRTIFSPSGQRGTDEKRVVCFLWNSLVNANEETLLDKAQAGDRQAFSQLMKEEQDIVFNMIHRQVGDRGTAEDLTQETFLKAYKGLKGFRRQSSFRTWIVRIALNQSNTYFKSKRYRQNVKNQTAENLTEQSSNVTAESALMTRQRVRLFRQALASLAPKYREVLILCGLEGQSYEMAAQTLNIPIGTVRSRLNTARLQARSFLSQQENMQ